MPKFRLTIDSAKIPKGFIPIAYRPPLPGEYILTSELEALKFPDGSSHCFIILKEVVQSLWTDICKRPAKIHCTIDIPFKQRGFSDHTYQLIDLRVPKDGDTILLSNYTFYTLNDIGRLDSIYPVFKRRDEKEKVSS